MHAEILLFKNIIFLTFDTFVLKIQLKGNEIILLETFHPFEQIESLLQCNTVFLNILLYLFYKLLKWFENIKNMKNQLALSYFLYTVLMVQQHSFLCSITT